LEKTHLLIWKTFFNNVENNLDKGISSTLTREVTIHDDRYILLVNATRN